MVPLCDSGQTVLVRIVKLYRKRNNPQSHCVLHENLVCSPTWKRGFAKEVWLYVTSVMSASSLLKELWMEAPLKPPSLDRISDDLEPSSVEAASLIFTHTAWYRFLQFWIFCCKLYEQKACWCPWPLQQILDNETLGREEETTMRLTLQFTEHPNLQQAQTISVVDFYRQNREGKKTPSVCLLQIRNHENPEISVIHLSTTPLLLVSSQIFLAGRDHYCLQTLWTVGVRRAIAPGRTW
jgi:hypothetical protein